MGRWDTHFRITEVDGGDFVTYVKDITREGQILSVLREAATGKLLDDMGPNAIELIKIDHLREREAGDVGDTVRRYLHGTGVRVGDIIKHPKASANSNAWYTVTRVVLLDEGVDWFGRKRSVSVTAEMWEVWDSQYFAGQSDTPEVVLSGSKAECEAWLKGQEGAADMTRFSLTQAENETATWTLTQSDMVQYNGRK
jgi:hypothetical protein